MCPFLPIRLSLAESKTFATQHTALTPVSCSVVPQNPTSTGEPGGMETGQSMTHYILPEGRYARAYAQLASSGYQLHWQSLPAVGSAKKWVLESDGTENPVKA